MDERAVCRRYILGVPAPYVPGHGFHETAQGVRYTVSEAARREVLGRLLELNHQRYAEEVAAGVHETKTNVQAKVEAEQKSPKPGRRKADKDDGGALKYF
jgi:hypothetical protein